MRDMTKELGLA